jgi:uncharacterized damage-inducible protein DinB
MMRGMSHEEIKASCDAYLGQYLDRILHSVSLLTEEQVWWRSNQRSNSVANLLLHLRGNLSQWVLEGLGGRAYERHRSREFSARDGADKAGLLAELATVVAGCRSVVRGLGAADLEAPKLIQGVETTGLRALLHAVEHMSYHTGQVVLVAKMLAPAEVEIEFFPQHRGE